MKTQFMQFSKNWIIDSEKLKFKAGNTYYPEPMLYLTTFRLTLIME